MGLIAVGAGAFTSHGLESWLLNDGLDAGAIPERLAWATTACDYLLVHAIALVACSAASAALSRSRVLAWSCPLLFIGTLVFCGSLMALAITGNETFSKLAPWGGMTLMAAWGIVAVGGLTSRSPTSDQNGSD